MQEASIPFSVTESQEFSTGVHNVPINFDEVKAV